MGTTNYSTNIALPSKLKKKKLLFDINANDIIYLLFLVTTKNKNKENQNVIILIIWVSIASALWCQHICANEAKNKI